jgi:ankyrin repeat protein
MKKSTKILALVPVLIFAITWYMIQNHETAAVLDNELNTAENNAVSFTNSKPVQSRSQQTQSIDSSIEAQEDFEIMDDTADEELNIQDEHGMTPLLRAIDQDQPQKALALIQRGANPNLKDNNGTHPFVAAIVMGEPALIEVLLQKGIDPDMKMDLIGTTPLMVAALENQIELVKLLVDAGANINHQNQEGLTALMMAADMGNAEIVEHFLQHRADRSLKDANGMLAADFADKRGLVDLAANLRP